METLSNTELYQIKISLFEHFEISQEYQLTFSFHGIPIQFNTPSQSLYKELSDYLPKSWKNQDEPEFFIYHSPIPESLADNWDNEKSSIVHGDTPLAVQRDFTAKVDGQICYAYFEDCINDGLHNFMRWFLSPKLLAKNKVILHCASLIVDEESCAIFLGPSGAGKTTMTSMGSPRKVLSDDMNLLDYSEEKLYCRPGGVGGLYRPDVSIDQKYKVKGIYWLTQAKENKISQLSPLKQSKNLLASFANLPWEQFNADNERDYLDLSLTLIKKCEVEELFFQKDPSVWTYLERRWCEG